MHEGHSILFSDVHRDRRVGGARSATDEGHARQAGDLCVANAHETRAALVAADDGLDGIAVVQRIERRQVAFTRHTKHAIDTLGGQAVDKQIRGATGHGKFSGRSAMRNSSVSRPSKHIGSHAAMRATARSGSMTGTIAGIAR